jgi:hypothetical protein
VLAVAVASAAGAQTVGPSLSIEVKPGAGPPRATPGSAIKLVGEAFDTRAGDLQIRWDGGRILGTARVNEQGELRRAVAIPADAAVGIHLVTVTSKPAGDTTGGPVGRVSIDVVANGADATVAEATAAPEAAGGETSFNRLLLVPAALALAGVLVGAMFVARRRRKPVSATG